MSKSEGQVEIVKVPKSKRLSKESLHKLDREISSHVQANKAMEGRKPDIRIQQFCQLEYAII